MDVRPDLPDDRDACLAIFDSNTVADRAKFEEFLREPAGPYFLMEHDGQTIGCGGFVMEPEPGVASLAWGMIRKDLQGQGLGRFLLMFRLREIGKSGGIERVRVEASPEEAKFFEHQGFRVAGAVGTRVELVKKLTVCP